MRITITRKRNKVSIGVVGPVREMSGGARGFAVTINPRMPNILLPSMVFAGDVGNNDTLIFGDVLEARAYMNNIRAVIAEFRRIS